MHTLSETQLKIGALNLRPSNWHVFMRWEETTKPEWKPVSTLKKNHDQTWEVFHTDSEQPKLRPPCEPWSCAVGVQKHSAIICFLVCLIFFKRFDPCMYKILSQTKCLLIVKFPY